MKTRKSYLMLTLGLGTLLAIAGCGETSLVESVDDSTKDETTSVVDQTTSNTTVESEELTTIEPVLEEKTGVIAFKGIPIDTSLTGNRPVTNADLNLTDISLNVTQYNNLYGCSDSSGTNVRFGSSSVGGGLTFTLSSKVTVKSIKLAFEAYVNPTSGKADDAATPVVTLNGTEELSYTNVLTMDKEVSTLKISGNPKPQRFYLESITVTYMG